jgi:hypothetical protein
MEDKRTLMQKIRSALRLIEPMAEAGWQPAQTMLRQLIWCEQFVSGQPKKPCPGPFSMGLIASRELDMYGDQPDLALLINDIQRDVKSLL